MTVRLTCPVCGARAHFTELGPLKHGWVCEKSASHEIKDPVEVPVVEPSSKAS